MKKKIFFVCALLTLQFQLNSVAIVTHGAWGDEMEWYKPGGYFHKALSISASVIGQKVYPFVWKQFLGGITHKERLNAGRDLAKLVVDFSNQGEREIILIGHSYGGHVIKAASQILAVALQLQPIDTPIIVQSKTDQIVNKSGGVEVKKANPNEWDQKYYEQVCNEVKKYKEEKLLNKNINKDFLMDAVYTLGTPNDIPDYEANMNVVGYLFNLHSYGDLVHNLIGDHVLPEPRHKRAVDLEIRIKGTGWFGLTNKPGHLKMHSEEIAKWILYIPFHLINEPKTGFNKFTFDRRGIVKFEENKLPIYSRKRCFFTESRILSFIKDFLGLKLEI